MQCSVNDEMTTIAPMMLRALNRVHTSAIPQTERSIVNQLGIVFLGLPVVKLCFRRVYEDIM